LRKSINRLLQGVANLKYFLRVLLVTNLGASYAHIGVMKHLVNHRALEISPLGSLDNADGPRIPVPPRQAAASNYDESMLEEIAGILDGLVSHEIGIIGMVLHEGQE